jgi:CBS domain-containing protein
MRVREVMNSPVRTIKASQDASVAWEQMQLHRVRHLVVIDRDGRATGILSASDVGDRHGDSVRVGQRVADLMTEKLIVATPETTIREAANLMRGHGVDCLPVFEGATLTGLVTALDLLELIGRGAERPVATAERRILKDRSRRPRALAVAKQRHGDAVRKGRRL